MNNKRLLSFQVGASFIGTIIGAGFASGQEIMFFFTSHGLQGILTLLLSGIIFSLIAYSIFYTASKLRAYNYKDYIYKLFGKRLAFIYDYIISVFLFLGTSIMFSGSGALFKENLGLPSFVGIIFIAIVTLMVILKSVKGILSINSIIVPILIFTILIVFLNTFFDFNINTIIQNTSLIEVNDNFKPIFSLLFYCSYNLTLSIGVLCAFTQTITQLPILKKGAIFGGIGLMLLSTLLNLCMLINVPEILSLSIPMLYIVRDFSFILKYAVTLCIWSAIFTTAVANAFSFATRISSNNKKLYGVTAVFVVISCLPLSLLDFKKLVAFFYPLFGALSIFLILSILHLFIKMKLKER